MSSSSETSDTLIQSAIVLEPPSHPARQAVIWLHGLGADGHDFEDIVPMLNLPEDHAVRFVFPNAPVQRVTVNNGMSMPAWYDIRSSQLMDDVDWRGIQDSSSYLHSLMHEQMNDGIESDQIVLAGFSQGGVIALAAALRFDRPLAGVMALSTYWPAPPFDINQTHTIPIFWGHGTQDPVCPYDIGQSSCEWLQQKGFEVNWHSYPMAHQVCPDEIEDMGNFIRYYLKL